MLLFCYFNKSLAQEFLPIEINHSQYPKVEIKGLFIYQNRIVDLIEPNLIINENGQSRDFSVLECDNTSKKKDYHLIIAIDVSTSMYSTNNELIKSTLSDVLSNYNNDLAKIAILAFSNSNYIISDFTNNRIDLINSLDKIFTYGSALLDNAFFSKNGGIFSLFNKVNGDKNLILITNGPNILDFESIADSVAKSGIRVNSIFMGLGNSKELKELSNSNNGFSLGNNNNYATLHSNLKAMLYLCETNSPCSIVYNSRTCNLDNVIDLNFTDYSVNKELTFVLPFSSMPQLKITPEFHNFGMRLPPSKPVTSFQITAVNGDIEILGIDESPYFKILDDVSKLKLQNGESREIAVQFEPKDTNYVFDELFIRGNHCNHNSIKVAGGSDKTINIENKIKVISPNGGEFLSSGGQYLIEWSGTMPNDTVKIDYSTNNGLSWINITNSGVGLKHNWSIIPNTISSNCLLKISHLSKYDLSKNIINLKGIQGNIVNMVWRDDRNELYTGSSDGFIRLWNAVNGEPIRTIVGGISNIIDFDISYDYRYVAYINGNGNKVSIINAENEFDVTEYELNNERAIFVDWNRTKNILAVSMESGKIYFYNFPSTIPFKIIENTELVTYFEWHRISDRFAVGFIDGNSIIYEIENEETISIKVGDQKINSLSFNPSGNFIASTSMNEYINIWEINSGINITSFNNQQKPVNVVAWDPTAKYITSASVDSSINIWQPANGNIIYKFKLHNNLVRNIKWRADGNSIASSTSFGEVFIWSPNDIPFSRPTLQEDISDENWSIVSPQINTTNVDFGILRINNPKDTVVADIIFNPNNYDVTIDTILIKSSFSPIKILNLPQFPYNLKAKSGLELKLNYNPVNFGFRIDSLYYLSGLREYKSDLFCDVREQLLEIIPNEYNFGVNKLNIDSEPSRITIKNVSNSGVFIQEIKEIFNDQNQFNVSGFSSRNLEPNEILEFEVKFRPVIFSESSAIFDVIYDGKINSDILSFTGSGAAPQINFQSNVELGDIICENELTYRAIIKNVGNEVLRINSISLNDEANEAISLDITNTNLEINIGDSTEFLIVYDGSESGLIEANVEIRTDLNADNTTLNTMYFSFNKRNSTFKILPNSLTYYLLNVDEEDIREIKLINTGTEIQVWQLPLENQYFKVESINPPTANIGDTSIAIIKFKGASETGLYSDKITFTDSCKREYIVNLTAFVGQSDALLDAVSSIEFPEIYCDADSITYSLTIKNGGTTPLIITSIEFANPFSDFYLTNDLESINIEADNQDIINIGHYPKYWGISYDTLIISTNAKNSNSGIIKIPISAFFGVSDFTFSDKLIIIDNLITSEKYSSLFQITNTGSLPIEIYFNSLKNILVIDSIIPNVINPGKISNVFFTFLGGEQGNEYSQVLSLNTLCDKTDSLEIRVLIDSYAKVGLKAGIINAAPGDTVDLPIFLFKTEPDFQPNVDAITTTISFNSTLLVPISTLDTYVKDGIRFINLTLPPAVNEVDPSLSLSFIATLGNIDTTIVSVNNSKSVGGSPIKIMEIDGKFSLDSVCYEGGVRLIGNSGVLKLNQNNPNPVVDITRFSFSAIEHGKHELIIFDLLGYHVDTIFTNNIIPGDYTVETDLSKLPIGNYIFKLLTPSTSLTRKMTIKR